MPDGVLPDPISHARGTRLGLAVNVLSSLDTLLLILAHLEAPDIVRLSMVCKLLYREIENNRIVWLRTVNDLELMESMVPFTYQTEHMDIRTLKNSACSPYRLASAIMGKGTVTTSAQTFQLDTAAQGPPPQYAMYLVPGGRWIIHTDRGVDYASRGLARISCSDLRDLDHQALHTCSFPLRNAVETWPTIHAVQADMENTRITVVVSYLSTFPTRCLEILHATWPSQNSNEYMPTWSRGAELDIDVDETITNMILEEDYVAIPLADSVVVWNWRDSEWGTVSFSPDRIRGAWLGPKTLYALAENSNTILVMDLPLLAPISEAPTNTVATPKSSLVWREGPRQPCEIGVLSSFQLFSTRRSQLCSIIHWPPTGSGSGVSGLVLIDFGDAAEPRILRDWRNSANVDTFGVHSGALQTVDVGGIALRAGRRFSARLQSGPSGVEIRVLGFSPRSEKSEPAVFSVPLPVVEWDQAEAYDSCTIYGRMLLRQYDSSSDSEHSSSDQYPSLALMDFGA